MNAASVLIYDSTGGSVETLCELLTREGLRPIVAEKPEDLAALYRLHSPPVLLFDAESTPPREVDSLLAVCDSASRNHALIVALGTKREDSPLSGVGDFVRKPYHYGPLVHRICRAVSGGGSVSSRAA